jgi:hypothetical protein
VIHYSDGSPAPGITVVAVPLSRLNGTAQPQSQTGAEKSSMTDRTGRYRIEGILPDTYNIVAGSSDSPVFYPGTRDLKAATAIPTTYTAALYDLNFAIPMTKGTSVRIHVSAAAGRPAGGSILELVSLDPAPALMASILPRRVYKSVVTSGDGSAEFADVMPGRYTVSAKLSPALPVSRDIDIKNQPVALDFSIPVHVLSGRVLWEDGSPFSDPVVNQVAVSTASNPNQLATTVFTISSGGVFSGVLESNEYRFFIRNLPQGYQIRSITSGTSDLTKEKLKIVDSLSADIEVRIAKKPNSQQTVSGRILDAITGMPAAAERVQLCCLNSGPVERMSTSLRSDGSFEFSGVPAGHYDVELKGKAAVRIVNSSIEVENQGKSGLHLVSSGLFATVTMRISMDGNIQLPSGMTVSVTLIPSSDETFRITTTGPANELLSATVPLGIQYDVAVSNLPAGFKVKSLSRVDLQSVSPGVAPPANSQPGYAGVYKATGNSSFMITLTRGE